MKTLSILTSLVLTCFILSSCYPVKPWRTASFQSAGMDPRPSVTKDSVLQVYGADIWSWRGWFAIHAWVATKRTGEAEYSVSDEVGWRGYQGQSVMRITKDIPNRYWFGEKHRIIKEHRGEGVDELIEAVDMATDAYTREDLQGLPRYSKTFIVWIAKQVPDLEL